MWQLGDRLFATTEKRFSIRRCAECDTDYLDAMPEAEELASYYPQGYWVGPASGKGGGGLLARASERYRRLVLRDHVGFAESVIEQQRQRGLTLRIIDVGCGDGSYLGALGADRCVGMDISGAALRESKRRGLAAVRGTVCAGERPTAPFADHSFSVITSFHFLEHVADPRPVLAELRRILHPDGDLILQVPNKDSWQARLLGRRWAGLDVPRHLVNYSARTLCRVLEESGFEVVRQSHFSLRDNPTTLANSLVPALYPPARQARRHPPTGLGAWGASMAYLAVTLGSLPFTLVESALGRGAAVMVQARHA
jgi:SAM-dependent methyltransferase